MVIFPPGQRLSAKSENCENSNGFYDPIADVFDSNGDLIEARTKIHDAIPQEDLVEMISAPPVDPIQFIYVKTGGPNVIWPISARGLIYRGRP